MSRAGAIKRIEALQIMTGLFWDLGDPDGGQPVG